MPSLGADMQFGTIVDWRVKPGDAVKRGDVVALVETEKGVIEVEIFENGVIESLVVQPGQKVPVGATLATLSGDGKKVATVGGAIVGGYSGNKVQEGMQERNVDQVNQRVCETTQESHEQSAGYDVTYLLDGEEKTVWMQDDPGRRIRIENGKPVIG